MNSIALLLQDPAIQTTTTNTNQMMGLVAAMMGFYAIMYLIQAAIFMVPSWFIAKKAGFSPWLSMLCIFPLTGVVFFYIVAFAEWKVVPAPQQAFTPQPPYRPYPTQPPSPPQV